jgi:hypothetical protein
MAARKPVRRANVVAERDGSIDAFCRRHNISRGTFYNYLRLGIGPAIVQAMPRGKVVITPEAEAAYDARHTAQIGKAVSPTEGAAG